MQMLAVRSRYLIMGNTGFCAWWPLLPIDSVRSGAQKFKTRVFFVGFQL